MIVILSALKITTKEESVTDVAEIVQIDDNSMDRVVGPADLLDQNMSTNNNDGHSEKTDEGKVQILTQNVENLSLEYCPNFGNYSYSFPNFKIEADCAGYTARTATNFTAAILDLN